MTVKTTVSVDVTIPAETIIYDVGLETVSCSICKTVKMAALYGASDGEGAGLSSSLISFLNLHGKCVLGITKRRKEPAQPCRADWRDRAGGGPHECGKLEGHSGNHGHG